MNFFQKRVIYTISWIITAFNQQWRRTYTQTGSLFTAFPIQFANEVYAVVCTEADAGVWKPTQAVISGVANDKTILGCTIHSRWIDNGVVISAGETITYVAIGQ